jgi:hypothetical protein
MYIHLKIHRPTFIKVWKMRSVEQYSPIPYVATLLNCLTWVLYGLPLVHPHSMLVITINGTGTAIELAYVTLFLLCSAGATRRKVLLLLAGELAFVGAVAVLVITLAHTSERRSMIVGALGVLFGTGMYAAPLSVMVRIVGIPSITCYFSFVPSMPRSRSCSVHGSENGDPVQERGVHAAVPVPGLPRQRHLLDYLCTHQIRRLHHRKQTTTFPPI